MSALSIKNQQKIASAFLIVAGIFFYAEIAISADSTTAVPSPSVQNVEQETYNRAFLRAVFTMRARRWPDGQGVRVFVYGQENLAHQLLCKKLLNMYPYQLRRSWDRMVYSGTGQAPIQVSSEQEMRDKVKSTPGAIGYVLEGDDDVAIITN